MLREFIKRIPVLGFAIKALYAKFRKPMPFYHYPSHWIPIIFPDACGQVVQIGSNDGKTGDPLHQWLKDKEQWTSLFVEPVPYLFDQLQRTYSDNRFSFENAVINNGDDVTFYWVSESASSELPDLPNWHNQLGGFRREHITNHLPELDDFIESKKLKGMSLNSLFEKHNLSKIDLLHIDTEGADFQILKQLDLETYRPRVILYERKHLSKVEEQASISFLQEHYVLFDFSSDILAVNKDHSASTQQCLKPLQEFRLSHLRL